MNLIQQYMDLRKQTKAAYRDMQNKRSQIICSGRDINTQDNVCLKVYPFPVFGMLIDDSVKTIELDHCTMFYENEYCSYLNCAMCQKNHEYIDSIKSYNRAKAAQRNFVKRTIGLVKH